MRTNPHFLTTTSSLASLKILEPVVKPLSPDPIDLYREVVAKEQIAKAKGAVQDRVAEPIPGP